MTTPYGVAAAHSLSAVPLKRVFGIYLVVIGIIMLRNALHVAG